MAGRLPAELASAPSTPTMERPAPLPPITAYRYVFGHVVAAPGGPFSRGIQQRATTVSRGLPASLLAQCDLSDLLGQRSLPGLIHPERQQRGALLFRPAVADGRRWLLASCVRARSESGEGGLGRAYPQLTTYVFPEAIWAEHAPDLLWNAEHWLRTDPDLEADHLRYRAHGDWPAAGLGPRELPGRPPCAGAALPAPGAPVWRLAAALERADGILHCGAADGIDSTATFLRALACVAALLPRPWRIYLTAAAGFSATEGPFALQYLPAAPPMPPAEPGLLATMALEQRHGIAAGLGHDQWHAAWARATTYDADIGAAMAALAAVHAWRDAGGARVRLAGGIDALVSARSVKALRDWLDQRAPRPPAQPGLAHPDAGERWVAELTGRIEACRLPERQTGLARALLLLTGLIELPDAAAPPSAAQRHRAEYWTRAWLRLAARSPRPREVLRWSALLASPLVDQAAGGRIGSIAGFDELRLLTTTVGRAHAGAGADAALLQQALRALRPAFERRVDALRRHAAASLLRAPAAIVEVAAVDPALLECRGGAALGASNGLAATIAAIRYAAALLAQAAPAGATPATELADAARRVARHCLGHDLGDDGTLRNALAGMRSRYLEVFLDGYWRWALAPETELTAADLLARQRALAAPVADTAATPSAALATLPGTAFAAGQSDRPPPALWRDAVVLLLIDAVAGHGIAAPTRLLLQRAAPVCVASLDGQSDLARIAPGAAALLDRFLWALAIARPDPGERAAALMQILLGTDRLASAAPAGQLDVVAPAAPSGGLGDPTSIIHASLAERLERDLLQALANARPDSLSTHLAPTLASAVEQLVSGLKRRPAPVPVVRRVLTLTAELLEAALADPAAPPAEPLRSLLARVEDLVGRLPERPGAPGPHGIEIDGQIDRLASLLGRCVLAWTRHDPAQTEMHWPAGLRAAPIRRRLAATLGFPRCAYFAGLTAPSPAVARELTEPGQRVAADSASGREPPPWVRLGLDGQDRVAARRLLALGAIRNWRRLGTSAADGHGDLDRLLADPSAAEVIGTLDELTEDGTAAQQSLIDTETGFVLALFRTCGPHDGRTAAPPRVPAEVRRALLARGSGHDRSYALRLGRVIANGAHPLGGHLTALLDEPVARPSLVEWLLHGGPHRDGGPEMSAPEWAEGLLRVLFVLGLVTVSGSASAPARLAVPRERIEAALHPGNAAVIDDVARRLRRGTGWGEPGLDLPSAFRRGAMRAGLDRLPGWPTVFQPRG
jgi:hypothetical protein